MPTIYRPKVPVGACTTLTAKSLELGGKEDLLRGHMRNSRAGFPKKVAQFGPINLYVDAELDAFYKSVMWRRSDAMIAQRMEG